MKILSASLVVATLVAIPLPAISNPGGYTLRALLTDNGADIYATDLNELGQVVGTSNFRPGVFSTYGNRAVVTGPNGIGVTDLGTLGGSNSSARGINDAGLVVGASDTDGFGSRGFLWNPTTGTMTQIPNLVRSWSQAYSINNSGLVAATGLTLDGLEHAYTFDSNNGLVTDLGALDPYNNYRSYTRDLNGSGQVVGYGPLPLDTSGPFAFVSRTMAFLYTQTSGSMVGLGTLGGRNSFAESINDAGQVVGRAEVASGIAHAFVTGPNGSGMIDLGVLGGASSNALDINNSGHIVGNYTVEDPNTLYRRQRAFVSLGNDADPTDLTSLIPLEGGDYFSSAFSINDRGQFLASTSFGKTYLISPVPEPATYALMLAGLGVLAGVARGRARRLA